MAMHAPNRDRIRTGPLGSDDSFGNLGAFKIPVSSKSKSCFMVISSDEAGWEHVSVSLSGRTPTWDEMCAIKAIFWDADDCVIQYHPPVSSYINNHQHCLHLWRPVGHDIPMPPSWMVGVKEAK